MKPTENDVLSGRGAWFNQHPGNEHFRKMIDEQKVGQSRILLLAFPLSQNARNPRHAPTVWRFGGLAAAESAVAANLSLCYGSRVLLPGSQYSRHNDCRRQRRCSNEPHYCLHRECADSAPKDEGFHWKPSVNWQCKPQ